MTTTDPARTGQPGDGQRASTPLTSSGPAGPDLVKPPGSKVPAGGRPRMDWVVFGVTAALALVIVVWGLISTQGLSDAAGGAQGWVITNVGWFFVLAASFFVVFALWLAASRYGKLPLGRSGEKPEFRTVSWIAMMFSAGMGIGLMFWGAAEPLSHYLAPPPGTVDAESEAALNTAMATTMFHWALHPWAIYAVVGIAIAYGTFRKGRSQLLSAAFGPLLGKRTEGPIGRVIDILAIFATLFGSAASLGLGALQIASGLQFNGWLDQPGTLLLVGIIAVLTVAFVASAVSGIAKGIQWLSNINMVLALVLAVFVFVVGPTLFVLNLIPTTLGDYAAEMVEMAARTDASGDEAMAAWLSGWTVFYWAWWISWTPFVGMFIARISRGRTIRQFVTGVLLVPSVVSLVWFGIFGGTAIHAQRTEGIVESGASPDQTATLFQVLDTLPLSAVTSVLVMALVAIFFVSGADAASVVMGTLSERGTTEPRRLTTAFWGVLTGAVAAIMLLIGQGGDTALTGLQALTVVAALPFAVVMLALCVSLWKDLRSDPLILREERAAALLEDAVTHGIDTHGEDFDLLTAPPERAAEIIEEQQAIHEENVGSPDPATDDESVRDGVQASGAPSLDLREGVPTRR